ncbi:MAG: hypothetical protein Q8R38_02365, partial [Candidatus Omnitrophota bacterium]|nr:hypothetical protein [Candidatus Omnitrophota bacterium]
VGEVKQIKWNSTGTVTPVNIRYSTSNGTGGWTDIALNETATAGANTYNWTVNETIRSPECLINVSDARPAFESEVFDTSNVTFNVYPQINVTSPASGQNVIANTYNTTINWSCTGSTISAVKIQYSANGPTGPWNWVYNDTYVNATNVPTGATGNYTWKVPSLLCDNLAMIKVTDADDDNVTDTSSVFNIVGRLELSAPNGYENWTVGSTKNVDWSQDQTPFINISYSTIGGGSWQDIATDYNSSQKPYPWTIDNDTVISNLAKIKIEDATNPTVVNDISTNNFSILARFDVTNPENYYVALAGDPVNITWDYNSTGVNYIILEYSTEAQYINWTNIDNASNPNATVDNTGTYYWSSIPGDTLSTTCRVRVRDPGHINGSNMSLPPFTIRGKIITTEPNATVTKQVGDNMTINWTRQGNIQYVKIEYSWNGGGDWKTVNTSVPANSMPYIWTIPLNETTTVEGKINITHTANNQTFNVSSGLFKIKGTLNLTDPSDSGLVLTYNGTSTHNITWLTYGGIPGVRLKYSTNNGSSWPYTINNTTGSPYVWPIPDAIGYNLSVKVEDMNDSGVNDTSNNTFAIKGSIFVLQPNGTESWVNGSTQQIQWKTIGTYSQQIELQYCNDSTSPVWLGINNTSAGADNQTVIYNWTIPDDITSKAKVKVLTKENNASIDVTDTSDNAFKIKGGVTIIEPNTNVTWFVGEEKQIKWNSTGTVTPVNIRYSTNNGSGWVNIALNETAVAGNNTYNWTVNGTIRSSL